jgi:hypothetical protein
MSAQVAEGAVGGGGIAGAAARVALAVALAKKSGSRSEGRDSGEEVEATSCGAFSWEGGEDEAAADVAGIEVVAVKEEKMEVEGGGSSPRKDL